MVGADLDKVSEYLEGIGMGEPMRERANEALARMLDFLPEEPRYFFVSEYRDADGNRNYESLWLLSDGFMSEAKQFVDRSQFDCTRVDRGLIRVLVSNEEFDFTEATDSSRLSVEANFVTTGTGINGNFKASGANCSDLAEILSDYVMPLLSRDFVGG